MQYFNNIRYNSETIRLDNYNLKIILNGYQFKLY